MTGPAARTRMSRRALRSACLAACTSLLAASPLAAQARLPQSPDPIAAADSLVAQGDSAGALRLLERAVRADVKNARLWHRRGVIAWGMSRTGRSNSFMRPEHIRRIMLADSALRTAVWLAPDSGRFALDLARFFLNSNLTTVRLQAAGLFEKAIASGRRAGDSLVVADATDELGMVHWRRYEAVADRYNPAGVPFANPDPLVNEPDRLDDYLRTFTNPAATEWSGQLDYLQATDLFTASLRANPNHGRALRHAFMALAERKRWEELRESATRRLGAAPWDPFAWLAAGLANHRMGETRAAAAAFDSALVLASDDDRARYTRLSRLLRPTPTRGGKASDSASFAEADSARRARIERLYWVVADPLAMTADNEHRLEFLARVAYAELRWTSDDLDRRGADTDRGDIHIRYGPPDVIRAFAPGRPEPGASLVIWTWRDGLSFVFRQPVTYGTASLYELSIEKAKRVREITPVRWGNVPITRSLDSIQVQAIRFRAPGDSTDFVLFADVPVDSLFAELDVRRGALDVDFRVYANDASIVRRDSTRQLIEAGAERDAVALRGWRGRLPAHAQLWRVEALQPDGMRAARAMGSLPRDTTTGFAMSDLLVAARVLPRDGTVGARWSDFNVAPSVGRFARGAPIALLWETYALAAKDDAARYRVSITLEKLRREGPLGVAARVIGGAGGVVGRTASGRGKLTINYDRTVAPLPITVDYLTLELGEAPPGRYRLIVEVTDQVSKRTSRRQRAIVIEP